MKIARRKFIGLVAGAAAGAALGGSGGRLFSDALSSSNQPIYPPRGPEQFILSVCRACPGGCGIRARRIGNRIVKVEGNPLHPISGGRLCPRGQAAIQALYHPDRLRVPMRRVGPRGSLTSFRAATWNAAAAQIAGRLRSIRDEQRPESVVLIRGADRDINTRVARRFLEAFGSPNDIPFDRGSEAGALALYLTQGVRATPAPDIRGADYILSLGSEFLEVSPAPVFASRAYGDFRQTRTARRGKLVQVDPRLSITAASADEWIPIRPLTHALFALGVAAAIVEEGLYDREFVSERSIGFEEGAGGGLRAILQQQFSLERVAAESGVSVNVILRIARELAGARKGLVLPPQKGPLLGGHLYDHLAVHILNALIGNVDQAGGVLIADDVPIEAWPAGGLDPVATAGRARPRIDGVGPDSMLSGDLEQLCARADHGPAISSRGALRRRCRPAIRDDDAQAVRRRARSRAARSGLCHRFRTTPRCTPTGFSPSRISSRAGTCRPRRPRWPFRRSAWRHRHWQSRCTTRVQREMCSSIWRGASDSSTPCHGRTSRR